MEHRTWSARSHREQGVTASWSGGDSVSAKGLPRRLGSDARGGGGPKASGTCGGGGGQSSRQKSARSQRRVSGRRTQGAARSMCASTRRWKAKAASPRRRGATCAKRREACGCCQAHSNCGQEGEFQGRAGKGATRQEPQVPARLPAAPSPSLPEGRPPRKGSHAL